MKQFSKWILEGWATWEVLRRLGFSTDEIFWEFGPTLNARPEPGFALNIVLRTQDRVFTVTCSESLTEPEAKTLLAEANGFQEELSQGKFDEPEMKELLHSSWVWNHSVGLLAALRNKGFVFPHTLS
jgi:hypothetical protein